MAVFTALGVILAISAITSFLRIHRGLGVHDNHAGLAHDDAVIRTRTALDPVNVVLDLRHFEGRGLLLRPGHLGK